MINGDTCSIMGMYQILFYMLVMTRFTFSVAGVPIAASVLYPSTRSFCSDYLTDESPAFSVEITQADINDERVRSNRQDVLDGIKPRYFAAAYLETLALYREIAASLLDYDTVIFHGSAIGVEGRAVLFTAPSGTGKTTHTRLWLEEIPGAHVVNGDKPLLRIMDDRVLACGTPWQGKENYGCNEILPLEAICILERSDENWIHQIGIDEALSTLIKQTHRPDEPELMIKTLSVIGKMDGLRFYRLGCNMDREAARVSYNGIFGG